MNETKVFQSIKTPLSAIWKKAFSCTHIRKAEYGYWCEFLKHEMKGGYDLIAHCQKCDHYVERKEE